MSPILQRLINDPTVVDDLLERLDTAAAAIGARDYGLPLRDAAARARLRAVVYAWLNELVMAGDQTGSNADS